MNISFLAIIIIYAIITAQSAQCNSLTRKLASDESEDIALTCRKTSNFDVCVNTLRSDPQSADSNLFGWAHIALDKAESYATFAVGEIDGLKSDFTRHEVIVLESCIQLYNKTINKDIPSAVGYLDDNAYGDAKKAVGEALNDGVRCQQLVDRYPSAKWVMISSYNAFMHDFCVLSSDLIGLLG